MRTIKTGTNCFEVYMKDDQKDTTLPEVEFSNAPEAAASAPPAPKDVVTPTSYLDESIGRLSTGLPQPEVGKTAEQRDKDMNTLINSMNMATEADKADKNLDAELKNSSFISQQPITKNQEDPTDALRAAAEQRRSQTQPMNPVLQEAIADLDKLAKELDEEAKNIQVNEQRKSSADTGSVIYSGSPLDIPGSRDSMEVVDVDDLKAQPLPEIAVKPEELKEQQVFPGANYVPQNQRPSIVASEDVKLEQSTTTQVQQAAMATLPTFSPRTAEELKESVYTDVMPNEANDKLFDAVAKGDLTAVKAAINDGAEVNAKDDKGQTPLVKVAGSNLEMFKYLLEQGAKPIVGEVALKGEFAQANTDASKTPEYPKVEEKPKTTWLDRLPTLFKAIAALFSKTAKESLEADKNSKPMEQSTSSQYVNFSEVTKQPASKIEAKEQVVSDKTAVPQHERPKIVAPNDSFVEKEAMRKAESSQNKGVGIGGK